MTVVVTIAGNLGADAEFKTVGSNDLCRFKVAGTVGFGDKKQTLWFDCTKWGKGAQGLAGMLTKGGKVTVFGELSTREHEGRTFLQVNVDRVALQGGGQSSGGGSNSPRNQQADNVSDDFDDDMDSVPF